MSPNFARRVPKELADKFDNVVADGPPESALPAAPPRLAQAATEPPVERVHALDPTVAALQEALDDLREDVRHGLAAAAQVQFDALAPVRAALERLVQETPRAPAWEPAGGSDVPFEALRDEVRHLSAQLRTAPAATVALGLGALQAQLEQLRQELQRDRGHRDALRAAVLDALGSARNETQGVRAQLERLANAGESREADAKATIAALRALRETVAEAGVPQEQDPRAAGSIHRQVMRALEGFRQDLGEQLLQREAREADIETLLAGLDAGLKAVRDVVNEVRAEDERAREAAARARHDLMRTLEGFREELVEQWREPKWFEAWARPVLDSIRAASGDDSAGVGSELSAGLVWLPAASEEQGAALEPVAAETAPTAASRPYRHEPGPAPNEEVLREVAALRGELADRAGQIDDFLRTAVLGANRWFLKMRDDLYQRIDAGGAARNDNGHEAVVAAIGVLRADVQELHTYLTLMDANLERFHDSVVESARGKPVRGVTGEPGTTAGGA